MQPPIIDSARIEMRRKIGLGIEDTVEVLFEAVFLEVAHAATGYIGAIAGARGIVHRIVEGGILAGADVAVFIGRAARDANRNRSSQHPRYYWGGMGKYSCPCS